MQLLVKRRANGPDDVDFLVRGTTTIMPLSLLGRCARRDFAAA